MEVTEVKRLNAKATAKEIEIINKCIAVIESTILTLDNYGCKDLICTDGHKVNRTELFSTVCKLAILAHAEEIV